MSERTEELFKKFDAACQKRSLTNIEIAFLLQVTPAMVTRYRSQTAAVPETRKDKFKIAANVLKAAMSSEGFFDKEKTCKDRLPKLVEAFRELYPNELKLIPIVY